MKFSFKRLLLGIFIIGLPLGRHTEIDRQTMTLRHYFNWFGVRISHYSNEETGLSLWAQKSLGLKSSGEWARITLGPFWMTGHVGTPPGNWFNLHQIYQCYLNAPDDEKEEVIHIANKILADPHSDKANELHNNAVDRWLNHSHNRD